MVNKKYTSESLEISREELRIKKKKIKLNIRISKDKSRKLFLSVGKFFKIREGLDKRIGSYNADIKATGDKLKKLRGELGEFVKESRRLRRLTEGTRKSILKEEDKIKTYNRGLEDLNEK